MRKHSRAKHGGWSIEDKLYFVFGLGLGLCMGFGLWMVLWVGNA